MTPSYKGAQGWQRLIKAYHYSRAGLIAAWQNEAAFREESLLALILIPLGLWLGHTPLERALLSAVIVLVLIVELLNSAIEASVDHSSLAPHPLAKRAKDIGSAAVFMTLILAISTWVLILWRP